MKKHTALVSLFTAIVLFMLPLTAAAAPADGRVLCTVVHFRQNVNNNAYVPYAEIGFAATPGDLVSAPSVSYEGFTLNTALSVTSGVADAAYPLELRMYYDRLTYPVSFDTDGGSPVARYEAIRFGAHIPVPPSPKREGYIFDGWYADETLSREWSFDSDKMPSRGVTLYARWRLAEYDIAFDVLGKITRVTYEYGSPVARPSDPCIPGFTFVGWDSSPPDTMPARELTLRAVFTVNTYDVTYYVNGEPYARQEYKFGEKITPPAPPSGFLRTFTGWTPIPGVMPAQSFEVDGSLVPNHRLCLLSVIELLQQMLCIIFTM